MPALNVPVELIETFMRRACEDYAKTGFSRDYELTYEVGPSYIKIIRCRNGRHESVHSFIVNKEGKFKLGDILKSANWKTPATNFARGNLFKDETYKTVCWTGAQ